MLILFWYRQKTVIIKFGLYVLIFCHFSTLNIFCLYTFMDFYLYSIFSLLAFTFFCFIHLWPLPIFGHYSFLAFTYILSLFFFGLYLYSALFISGLYLYSVFIHFFLILSPQLFFAILSTCE